MQTLTKELVERVAQETIQNIRTHFVNDEGLLVGNDTSRPLIIDDLGDFIPFIAYFGDEDLCKAHLEYLQKHVHTISFQEAFKYTDLLLGLLWYERLGVHKKLAREVAELLMQRTLTRFFNDAPHSFIGYKRFHPLFRVFNTADTTFIEVFVEYYRMTGDDTFIRRARDLAYHSARNAFFKEHGLLPELMSARLPRSILNRLDNRSENIRLMKNNTNFGFGLLDLWRETKDEKIKEFFYALADGFMSHEKPKGGMSNLPLLDEPADLLSSFATIDMFCDAHELFGKEQHLAFAERIANFWLERQSDTTGLFPKRDGERMSYLDSETDMIIALFKLHERTDKGVYREQALRALTGLLEHHKGEKGYILEVDVHSGEPLDERYKTKYLALFLKPLIYLHLGEHIYDDCTMSMLMKDR